MWKKGKRAKTGCHFYLVLFKGEGIIDENGDIWLSEEDIVEELYEWSEVEDWLKENPGPDKDVLHLSIAADTVSSLYRINCSPMDADYWSAVIVSDIRKANLTEEDKENLENKAYKIRLEKIQRELDILGEDGVINKIKISNLFNKYDISLNLSKPVNILIGANGIGKTTVIKLINNYFNTNYVDIVAAPFEKIEYLHFDDAQDIFCLEDGEYIKEILDYKDFFPDKTTVVDQFCKGFEDYLISTNTQKDGIFDLNVNLIGKTFSNMLEEIDEAGLYGQFLFCSLKKKNYPRRIVRVIDKWQLDISIIEKIDFVKETYFNMRKHVFSDSTVESLVNGHEINSSDLGVYYIDFVESIRLNNDIVKESEFYCSIINGLSKIQAQLAYTEKGEKILIYSPEAGMVELDPHYIVGPEAFSSVMGTSMSEEDDKKTEADYQETPISIETYRRLASNEFTEKNTYKIWDFQKTSSTDLRILSEMTRSNIFNINNIINQNFYDDEFVLDINNKAINRMKEFFSIIESGDGNLSNEGFEREYGHLVDKLKEYKLDYEEYVRPTLIRNSFYCIDYNNLSKSFDEKFIGIESGKRERIAYIKSMIDYMEEVIPLLKDESRKTEKIKKYEQVVRKYMIGKYISITPSGISIRDSYIGKENNKTMVVYDEDEIDLSVLSSGEKKILILFALQVFFSNFMFLLDEPELSLSILWQETLVPDLISSGSNHFIIATHSPYIAANESVREFISFLPQGKD